MPGAAGQDKRALRTARLPQFFDHTGDPVMVRTAYRCRAYPDEEQQAALTPGKQPAPSEPPGTVKTLGLSIANLTQELKERFSLAEDSAGVVVVDVAPDSAASEKGMRAGDVIVEVAQEEVKNPAEISTKIDEAKKAGRKSVLLLVDRQGDLRFVALKLDQS